MGAGGGAGRAGRARDRAAAGPAVAGALVHALRRRRRGHRRPRDRPRSPGETGRWCFPVDAHPEHRGIRCPERSTAPECAAGDRLHLDSRVRRPRRDVHRGRADDRRRRAAFPPRAAGRARVARSGLAEHRRLGAAGRSNGLGLRGGGPGCRARRRDCRRLRRPRARREPAGRDSARHGLASTSPWLGALGRADVSSSGRKEPPMRERPYTLLSCCVSIDGYIGNAASRLLLSNEADFDRVDAVRASCDAILVGAETVRVDNPRLLVRSEARREDRAARGLPESPIKVTVTRRAELDARADFFNAGDAEKIVYCASSRAERRARSARSGRDRRRRRRQHRDAHAQYRPRGARRRAPDGRGRRHRPHAIPHRRHRRRVAA